MLSWPDVLDNLGSGVWVFKVMIHVAQEGSVEAVGFELHAAIRAEDDFDVLKVFLSNTASKVLDELGGNINGKDLTIVADGLGKRSNIQSCSRSNICYRHARLQFHGRDDRRLAGEDFAAFNFKAFDEVLNIHIRIEEALVDACRQILRPFLSGHRAGSSQHESQYESQRRGQTKGRGGDLCDHEQNPDGQRL